MILNSKKAIYSICQKSNFLKLPKTYKIFYQKPTKKFDVYREYIGEIQNHYYKMLEIKNRDSVMKKESEINSIKKEHHKYIPPKNHPWRKNMMLKH